MGYKRKHRDYISDVVYGVASFDTWYLKTMTKEEFDYTVVLPIRGAFRDQKFLKRALEYDYWYTELKYHDQAIVMIAVHDYIKSYKTPPVLAEIIRLVEHHEAMAYLYNNMCEQEKEENISFC